MFHLSILTYLVVATSPYHSLGQKVPTSITNSSLHEAVPHNGCKLMLKDKEPPHEPLVGKGYEDKTTTNYKVENEAGSMAAQCVGGFAAGYPCNNVNLLSMLPISDLDDAVGFSTEANDIWGWTHASTGREFALIGLYKGTAFVEITDPVNPVYLGGLPTQASGSSWRDIKTFDDFAYIVSEEPNHGMQVFDLTELLDASTGTVFSNTARYTGVGSSHNIFINEDTGYAYIVGASSCSGGLHMVNINSPSDPQFAGCYSGDGYTHDVQCVIYDGPDSTYTDNEICFASNEDTITIVDVTDKSNPILISKKTYANDEYTHQGWLTEDHSHFIFNDELDELSGLAKTATHVMDVSDLNNMVYKGLHQGRTAAIDHNNYVLGEYLYQANYRAGFNILKITDVTNVEFEEIGFFDIYPTSDSSSFNGAWSNYPYFPSGTIIVSGIEQGLFMLEYEEPSPTVSPVPTATPTVCTGEYLTVLLTTDRFASETSWQVTNAAGIVVMQNGALANSQTYSTTQCLSPGCFTFTISDSYGDGICCVYGQGSFSVIQGDTVLLSGGEFEFSDSVEFCLGTTSCVDSGFPISNQGNSVTCAQIGAADVFPDVCSNPVVSSHCPLTCNACEEYKCDDSLATWRANGNNVFCDQLYSVDPSTIASFCAVSDEFYTTCRDTCDFCS